jgi:hypothetical protein
MKIEVPFVKKQDQVTEKVKPEKVADVDVTQQ